MKLLTIADGFGDSGAHPSWYPDYYKWPELIELMTRNVELTNLSRYGAGNEYIINSLRQGMKIKPDRVIVQWAMPNRLDLLLAHTGESQEFWADAVKNDAVYSDNVVNDYWITSASKNPAVREYHRRYISLEQHRRRTQLYIEHASMLLELTHTAQHRFMLTADSDYLDTFDDEWIWHERKKGMDSFRTLSQYADLDFGYTQPIPLIQFDYIQQYIMPKISLPWRGPTELKAVESMLHRKYKEAIINKPNDTH